MTYQFKGIVRGSFSKYQAWGFENEQETIWKFESMDLKELFVDHLVLPEWIFTLRVNGKKIVDPVRYLKRKGIWNMCLREEIA